MAKLTNAYWHNPEYYGTGLLTLVKDDTVAGTIYTLGRDGNQIVLVFSDSLNKLNHLELFYYKDKGWPADGKHQGEAQSVGFAEIIQKPNAIDKLTLKVSILWPVVDPAHPSPLPPPSQTETFTLQLNKLF